MEERDIDLGFDFCGIEVGPRPTPPPIPNMYFDGNGGFTSTPPSLDAIESLRGNFDDRLAPMPTLSASQVTPGPIFDSPEWRASLAQAMVAPLRNAPVALEYNAMTGAFTNEEPYSERMSRIIAEMNAEIASVRNNSVTHGMSASITSSDTLNARVFSDAEFKMVFSSLPQDTMKPSKKRTWFEYVKSIFGSRH